MVPQNPILPDEAAQRNINLYRPPEVEPVVMDTRQHNMEGDQMVLQVLQGSPQRRRARLLSTGSN